MEYLISMTGVPRDLRRSWPGMYVPRCFTAFADRCDIGEFDDHDVDTSDFLASLPTVLQTEIRRGAESGRAEQSQPTDRTSRSLRQYRGFARATSRPAYATLYDHTAVYHRQRRMQR